MESPDLNRRAWIGNQIDFLKKKQERIEMTIGAAEMIRTTGVLPSDMDGNKDYTVSGFLVEVGESMQKIPPDCQKMVLKVLGNRTFNIEVNKIIDYMESGEKANKVKVQCTVGKMRYVFRNIMGKGSSLGFSNWGLMMGADGVVF